MEGDQDIGSPGRQVCFGLPVLSRALSCKNKTSLVTFPRPAFFLQNVLRFHQQIRVILLFGSLALWKILNEEDAILIPKFEAGENFSSGFLESEFFGAGRGGGSRYTATPLIVALSPGHSDITRFRPWSPIATGNHLDRAEPKKFKNLLRRMAPLTFFIRVQAFRNSSLDPAFRRSTRTSTQRIRQKKYYLN